MSFTGLSGGGWQSVTEAEFDHEQFAIYVGRAERVGEDSKNGLAIRRELRRPSRS